MSVPVTRDAQEETDEPNLPAGGEQEVIINLDHSAGGLRNLCCAVLGFRRIDEAAELNHTVKGFDFHLCAFDHRIFIKLRFYLGLDLLVMGVGARGFSALSYGTACAEDQRAHCQTGHQN